ncbi:OFA family MFS transporter [uncultured Mucilaginibacter sp.]|uniref:L-lactate MFS transporter n=1 Tax=uncultured Mucilaginibacter sp. TaxID=797541 RepID=UPI0025DC7A28|nr:OFA family MFS transporter [uncultured Mucilaginibacter sp.]
METKNKWLMAIAGMTLQLCIGSIYAYSVWIKPIQTLNGWDAHQLKTAFSLAICFLGLTAAFMGKFVQKIGPVKSGLLAALLFCTGLAGAGFANSIGSLPLFFLFYGVIAGIGLGFGYITPVSVVVKWFPDKPGLASGLVIMSFAAGSILAAQLITPLTLHFGVPVTFYLLAAAYAIFMVPASLYLAAPKQVLAVQDDHSGGADVPLKTIIGDVRYYALFLMLFLNTTCGIALIAVAAPMAKAVLHMSEVAAIAFVSMIGLFNGLGRLFWSSISDKIGRWNTFMTFYVVGAICFLVIAQTPGTMVFQIMVFLIISCYGGAFATMPAFIKDIYGADKVGPVFGYVLLAWSAAAFVGPWLISRTSNYQMIFYVFAAILAFTGVLLVLLKGKLKPGPSL